MKKILLAVYASFHLPFIATPSKFPSPRLPAVLMLGTGLGLYVDATMWDAGYFIINYLAPGPRRAFLSCGSEEFDGCAISFVHYPHRRLKTAADNVRTALLPSGFFFLLNHTAVQTGQNT